MITADQPTIFGNRIIAAVSSVDDGNMKFGRGDAAQIRKNQAAFLRHVGIAVDATSLVAITYDTDDFTKYRIVSDNDKAGGMKDTSPVVQHADALVTDQIGHALFLPVADCVGVIIYDPVRRVLMVSHIGRHSAAVQGATKSVRYLQDNFGSDPRDLLVWLSPAVGGDTYPLHAFDGKGLHEVIQTQLNKVGVLKTNIETSRVDTATDVNYFSHSQHLKSGTGQSSRFAVVAQMVA